jgi:Fe-S-cluster-containing hydrogenase component 2
VISIDIERCTGCGACLEVCPAGALYLVDGKATVDKALCRENKACLAACPSGAIILTEQGKTRAEAPRLPALRQEAIQVRTQAAPVLFRSRVLPLMGTALIWAGREILPWLADLIDRRTIQRQAGHRASSRVTRASHTGGRGRQHRHRRRGGSK